MGTRTVHISVCWLSSWVCSLCTFKRHTECCDVYGCMQCTYWRVLALYCCLAWVCSLCTFERHMKCFDVIGCKLVQLFAQLYTFSL